MYAFPAGALADSGDAAVASGTAPQAKVAAVSDPDTPATTGAPSSTTSQVTAHPDKVQPVKVQPVEVQPVKVAPGKVEADPVEADPAEADPNEVEVEDEGDLAEVEVVEGDEHPADEPIEGEGSVH